MTILQPVSAQNSTSSAANSTTINVSAGTSATALQAIIDAAPNGATIQLAAGTFRFNTTVVIARDDITLTGAGTGQTIIIADASLNGAPAIRVGAPLFVEPMSAPTTIATAATQGSTTLTLTAGHGLHAGDTIWIEAENTAALFDQIGDLLWRDDKPLRTALATVVSVSGNTVTLDRGLTFDFPTTGTTVQTIDMVSGVTLSNFTLRGAYGASDPSLFTNTLANENGGMMLLINGTIGTVLQGIDLIEPGSNGVVIGKTLDANVIDVLVDGAHNKGDGGNGYGFWLRDVYDSNFTNLTITDVRHAVLFASYTSAVGNTIHVTYTNRDINFHGGLDHDNVVTVDVSIRIGAEQGYLGATSFFNEGTTYGPPTDQATNIIQFRQVIGTVRADTVVATDNDAVISTLGGNDSLTGGRGDDLLDGGTGDDIIHASAGRDVVIGGYGTDTLIFADRMQDVLAARIEGRLVFYSSDGMTQLTSVEQINFANGTLNLTELDYASSSRIGGINYASIETGGVGFERLDSAVSVVAGNNLDAVQLTGIGNIDFVGNSLDNNALGNDGDNMLLGWGGDDRLFGGRGNDILNGGGGNDVLQAGSGDDRLCGGTGIDTLTGRQGVDTFIASGGTNYVDDFSFQQGDRLDFDGHSGSDLMASLRQWLINGNNPAADFAFAVVQHGTATGLSITSDAGCNLVLLGITAVQMQTLYDLG